MAKQLRLASSRFSHKSGSSSHKDISQAWRLPNSFTLSVNTFSPDILLRYQQCEF